MKLSRESRQALLIAGVYLAVGVLWIVFSDRLVAGLVEDSHLLTSIQSWKGSMYVAITAVLLFLLVRDAIRRSASLPPTESEFAHRYLDVESMAPIGIFRADVPGEAMFINERAAQVMGKSTSELVGAGWQSLVHEEDRERLMHKWRMAVAKGGTLVEEFRIMRPDGVILWVTGTASPQFDRNGRVLRYVGMLSDITERKQTELALEDSLRKYSELADLSPVGIYHADAHGKITYVNARGLEIAGADSDAKVLGDAWVSNVHEDDRDHVVARWNESVANATEYHQEYRSQGRDGKLRWIIENARPVTDGSGKLSGFIGTVSDVTPMKNMVSRLHESEAYRRLIVELEPECVKVLAPDGSLREMNPAGLKMIDADGLDDVQGKLMSNLVVPEDRAKFIALHKKVMQGGTGTLAFDIVSLKGTRRHLETHAVPLRDGGNIIGLLGVTRDITEQRKAEELIRQSEIRYRELYEANPLPMCLWDPATMKFLAVNDAMVEHYGYAREEFLKMSLLDIRPPEDAERIRSTIETAKKGAYAAGVWRHFKKNGELIEVDVRSHPIGYGDGKVMLAQMTDITSQRRAEAALAKEQQLLRETSARLNHILSTSPTLLFSVRLKDGEFKPVWISDNIERIFGYTVEESFEPGWWVDNMHPDDRQRTLELARMRFESADSLIDEFRFFKKTGEVLWVRVEARCVSKEPGSGMEIVGTWNDITEERKTQERLRLDAAAFESTRDGVLITDLDSRIISVNRALLTASGYSESELLGRTPRLMRSGRHEPEFFQAMWNSLKRTGHWQGEVWNRSKSGESFPVWLTISAVYNDRAEPTHYVAIYTDISKLKQSEEELHTLAHYDPLTQLPNRLLFQSRLEHAVDQAQRHDNVVALIFLDLDDFKKVNDSLGHVVGDELLRDVARRLLDRIRDEDTLARLGGDEFVVLLESLDRPEDAGNVARDLLRCLAMPFGLSSNHELYVHGSIGISVFPSDGRTPAELLRAADTAMYRAKDEGGDRLLFFTSRMSSEVMRTLQLENALRLALERGEFLLHYQPKLRIDTGEVRGVEALLRWRTEQNEYIPPNEFIPIAERTGLIVPIGNWVIDAACAQFAQWRELGFPLIRIAVNVSARQFRSTGLEQTIKKALKKHSVPPECLAIELTESLLMQRPEQTTEALARLKKIGVLISLDDFGTGFSSLAYLSRFPIDTLKVDSTFVQSIESDESARQIIRAIIELADGLGLDTVAEGVETSEQLKFLKDLGCLTIQGYYFSKPLAAREFNEFYGARGNVPAGEPRKRRRRARAK